MALAEGTEGVWRGGHKRKSFERCQFLPPNPKTSGFRGSQASSWESPWCPDNAFIHLIACPQSMVPTWCPPCAPYFAVQLHLPPCSLQTSTNVSSGGESWLRGTSYMVTTPLKTNFSCGHKAGYFSDETWLS